MAGFAGRVTTVLSVLALTSCSELTGPEAFPRARAMWDEQNLSHYLYVGTRSSFIGQFGPVTVIVDNDQVVRVLDQDGAEVSTSGWLTIDALFDEAERAIADDELNHIEFDESAGYPTVVDTGDWALDGGMRRTISNLQATVHPD